MPAIHPGEYLIFSFSLKGENQSQTCDTEITAETCLPYPYKTFISNLCPLK